MDSEITQYAKCVFTYTGQVNERPNSGYIVPILAVLTYLIFHELKSAFDSIP